MNKEKIHVLFAGNIQQAREFALEHGLSLFGWLYLDRTEQLYGIEGPLRDKDSRFELHFIGTWWTREHLNGFLQLATSRGFSVPVPASDSPHV